MRFEITLRYTTPLSAVSTLDEALGEFLRLIGYLREGEDDGSSIAYRLVRSCFIANPGRAWSVNEMANLLKTTRPTLYKHLNRLKALDILEEVPLDPERTGARKGYRLRYGNLARAWDFTEANASNALKRYREGVEHIQKLSESAKGAPQSQK